MIRAAAFADIPGIVRLLQAGHMRSHYALSGLVDVDVGEAKRLLMNAIQRHGQRNGGGCYVQVVDSGASIDGVIVATLSRVYSIGNKLMATDLFWIVNENAGPHDALNLMRGMIEWAKACPHCVEVHCGTTAIIAEDPEVSARLLGTLGMKRYGIISRLELEAR